MKIKYLPYIVWFSLFVVLPAGSFFVPIAGAAATVETQPASFKIQAKDPLLKVPFTSQAPFGGWSDKRQQDGCEEASAVMAIAWVKGSVLYKQNTLDQILAISKYEEKHFKNYHDTSVADTVKIIFKGYFKYPNVSVKYDITKEDIKAELRKGNLVIVPTNGQKLKNPNYKSPGPLTHNLVIKGYDSKNGEFITNDSGTRKGENYRYKYDRLMGAIVDYPTGIHLPVNNPRKAMIIVMKRK
jgi:hypothetical protein